MSLSRPLWAQTPAASPPSAATAPADQPKLPTPAKVDVQPLARDDDIRQRLESILQATDWFVKPQVRVDEGVVFLTGSTNREALKAWAGDLAQRTQDVVAVVNQLTVTTPSVWDLRPAVEGLHTLWHDFLYSFPFLACGLLILLLAWGVACLTTRGLRRLLQPRLAVALLREVIVRAAGVLVLVLGIYLVLKIAGLTRLALTMLGGTGLIGLVIGIAFRNITENVLASILLSVQRPFRRGDLVDIAGVVGYVHQLNVRTTVLMALSGHHVQIPNATVYQSIIRNYTSNPNRREDFILGIGYEVRIPEAQAVALQVLAEHPAVLQDPEPWVLVDSLGSTTVNLRIYFWLDGSRHSWLKVKSSVIRLIKRAFQEHNISMPDEAREVIFPQGIMVHVADGQRPPTGDTRARAPEEHEPHVIATQAEGGLQTDAAQLEAQAQQARPSEAGQNLLRPAPVSPAPGSC
ncbi:MAG: mechanosensitive ion channel domain-containing protein [Candidatus Tectimicrobiota bacterium]